MLALGGALLHQIEVIRGPVHVPVAMGVFLARAKVLLALTKLSYFGTLFLHGLDSLQVIKLLSHPIDLFIFLFVLISTPWQLLEALTLVSRKDFVSLFLLFLLGLG